MKIEFTEEQARIDAKVISAFINEFEFELIPLSVLAQVASTYTQTMLLIRFNQKDPDEDQPWRNK